MRSPKKRWRAKKTRQQGFTMIEVLVALAIIAMALAASLRAVASLATSEADLHRRCSRAGAPTTNSRSCGCPISFRTSARAVSTARRAT